MCPSGSKPGARGSIENRQAASGGGARGISPGDSDVRGETSDGAIQRRKPPSRVMAHDRERARDPSVPARQTEVRRLARLQDYRVDQAQAQPCCLSGAP